MWLLSTVEMKTHCSSHAGHLSLFPVCLCRSPGRCIQVFPSLPSNKAYLPHSLRTVPRSHSQRSLNSCALNLGNLRNCYFKNLVLKNRISFCLLLPWSLVLVHINVLRQGKFSDFLLVFEGLRTLSVLFPCIVYRISCRRNFLLLLSINSGAWQMSSFRLNLTLNLRES